MAVGQGLMAGVELVRDRTTKEPAGELGVAVTKACLRRGLLILAGGEAGNVLSFSPPLTITPGQLEVAVQIVADALTGQTGGA